MQDAIRLHRRDLGLGKAELPGNLGIVLPQKRRRESGRRVAIGEAERQVGQPDRAQHRMHLFDRKPAVSAQGAKLKAEVGR